MQRSDLEKSKIRNLERLKEEGEDLYPRKAKVTHTTEELKENFEELSDSEEQIASAGRIMAVREHGKSCFMNIKDRKGQIQLYFKFDEVGEDAYNQLEHVDIGDFINVFGKIFKTRTDEKTILVDEYKVLTKSVKPLPEKWHGLQDRDLRIRKRYLDLIMNDEVKDIFEKKSQMLQGIRDFLKTRDYQEVTTPILQKLYGGASARPFKTYHNALDLDLYLRIADELYLKRLVVGGMERVFEIGKNFRNEGIDRLHNPEFEFIELYEAYADYEDMMELTEELVSSISQKVLGEQDITFDDQNLSLQPPYPRVKFKDIIEEKTGIDITEATESQLEHFCDQQEIQLEKTSTFWNMVDKIFEEFVEGELVEPTFVIDYPIALSPLAKKTDYNPDFVERFELFVGGLELANAFTELNDPFEQRKRFEQQEGMRAKGDEEAQKMDEDFIEALEYGMPPTGGMGMGIDRLTMLLTDTDSIREVILFPLTKPKGGQ